MPPHVRSSRPLNAPRRLISRAALDLKKAAAVAFAFPSNTEDPTNKDAASKNPSGHPPVNSTDVVKKADTPIPQASTSASVRPLKYEVQDNTTGTNSGTTGTDSGSITVNSAIPAYSGPYPSHISSPTSSKEREEVARPYIILQPDQALTAVDPFDQRVLIVNEKELNNAYNVFTQLFRQMSKDQQALLLHHFSDVAGLIETEDDENENDNVQDGVSTGGKRKALTSLTNALKYGKAPDGSAIARPVKDRTRFKGCRVPKHLREDMTHAEAIKATKKLFHEPEIGGLPSYLPLRSIMDRYPKASSDTGAFFLGRFQRTQDGRNIDQQEKLVMRIIHPGTGEVKIICHGIPNNWDDPHSITVLNRWRSQAMKRYTGERQRDNVQRYDYVERKFIRDLVCQDPAFKRISAKDRPQALTEMLNERFAGKLLRDDELDEWRMAKNDEERARANTNQLPRKPRTRASVASEYSRHLPTYEAGKIPTRRLTVMKDGKRIVTYPEEEGYASDDFVMQEEDDDEDTSEMTGIKTETIGDVKVEMAGLGDGSSYISGSGIGATTADAVEYSDTEVDDEEMVAAHRDAAAKVLVEIAARDNGFAEQNSSAEETKQRMAMQNLLN